MALDPLKLLVHAIANRRDIRLLREDALVDEPKDATHISFPSIGDASKRTVLPAATMTRYLNPTKEPYDLRSLLLSYMYKDQPNSVYIRQVRTLEWTLVSLVGRAKLHEYLEGKRQPEVGEIEPEKEDPADEAGPSAEAGTGDGGRPAKRAKYVVNREDVVAVKQILATWQEPRQLTDRKRVLRGVKPNNFDGVRGMISERLNAAREELKRATKMGPAAVAAPAAVPGPKKRMDPIIIVSPSSSALITMDNVKRFLEDGIFEAHQPQEKRAQAEDVVAVMHKRNISQTPVAANAAGKRPAATADGIRPARYIVVNDANTLNKYGDEVWDRVVCVMTTGQEWQFRPYKWSEPKELFHHVKGIHFSYTNSPVNEKVKSWNVTDLRIDPVKRHVDKSVVAEFWRCVEAHIVESKPYLSF